MSFGFVAWDWKGQIKADDVNSVLDSIYSDGIGMIKFTEVESNSDQYVMAIHPADFDLTDNEWEAVLQLSYRDQSILDLEPKSLRAQIAGERATEAIRQQTIGVAMGRIEDIVSSGQGGSFNLPDSKWHVEQLTKLVNEIDFDIKDDVWDLLKQQFVSYEGWSVADIMFMAKLFGKKNVLLYLKEE